jgi:death-on-curing protein
MPDFGSRYPGKLESCLQMPFARFAGVHFHRGILKKSVALFYYCTKDHPFENGNKRFAIVMMFYFLIKNGKWLDIDPITLYELSKAVAEEKDRPEVVIKKIVKAFKPYLQDFQP